MKKLFPLILVLLFASGVYSQNLYVTARSGVGQPFAKLADEFKNGFNGSVNFAYSPEQSKRGLKYMITVSAGYQNFISKISDNESYHIIPISAGIIFPFDRRTFVPYLSAEVGLFITEFSTKDEDITENSLGLSPGLGFYLAFNRFWGLDFNTKFVKVLKAGADINFLSYNVGLIFRM